MTGETDYALVVGSTVLARITNVQPDQPWFEADFAPTPSFEEIRPLVTRAAELLDREAWNEWEQVWDEVRGRGVRLRRGDDGAEIDEFAIYVQEGRCRFRY